MANLKQLEKEIKDIKERNRRVEADKAWERSYVRRLLIVIFTYLAIALYLNAINVQNAWLNAVVPAVAFTLSTLTFPYFKKIWLKYKGIES
jgi:hypothetical protein